MKLRLEPRLEAMEPLEIAIRTAAGLAVALVLAGGVLAVSGHHPVTAIAALFRGAFGSFAALQGTLNKAVPIGLCAIGIALASRTRLVNIGAEGQLFFGAFAATGIGLALPETISPWTAIPLFLFAGVVGGAVWSAVAAIPRALLGMNEILSTLMLNYIAVLWVGYLVRGPWADPLTYSFPYSPPIAAGAQLEPLIGNVHGGVIILLAAVLLLHVIDRSSRWGYELKVSGDAPRAALYAGINQTWIVISALCFSGAMAGLAGAIEVSASTGRLQLGLSPGYGFMGILVAWLAGGRAIPILLVSIFYAGLLNGGFSLQVSHIPGAIGTILQAMILIFVLGAITLGHYRIRWQRSAVTS